MTVGDLVILHNCQTTGYKDGEVGILVKIEAVGALYSIYWILMSDGNEVPMWDTEFKLLGGARGFNNCN
jgi:hypothetical protein